MKNCKICLQLKRLREFPQQQMNKDGHGKTCIQCLNEKKRGRKPGPYARSLLKEIKNRPKTPQQLRRIAEEKLYQKNKKELLDEMFAEFGCYFCQHSGTGSSRAALQCHHIVFRSELTNHPEVHNKRNLLLVNQDSHDWYEEKKANRIEIVAARNLEELFGTRISFYQNTKCLNIAEKSDTVPGVSQGLDCEKTNSQGSQKTDTYTDVKSADCTI